jgi:hypothetical protein
MGRLLAVASAEAELSWPLTAQDLVDADCWSDMVARAKGRSEGAGEVL